MSFAGALFCALLLDALLGEPDWAWKRVAHPAVLMGRAIGWMERHFNEGNDRFAKGALGLVCLIALVAVIGNIIQALPFGGLLELLGAAILLAQKSLSEHVQAVSDALRQSTEHGRRAVAMIVGRDTDGMQNDAIARSAIESAAENFSDGIVAPAFWFLIAGLPGMLVYKMVNTADSMIGYRNPRYEQFGKFAARLDDVMNWVPARLTALILILSTRNWEAWKIIRQDAALHRSPNAGWPEAAMAATLGVALSGPRAYDGEMKEFPWVNGEGCRKIGAKEVDQSVDAIWSGWLVLVVIVGVLAVV